MTAVGQLGEGRAELPSGTLPRTGRRKRMELSLSETLLIEAIKTIPAILWVIFAGLVFLATRKMLLPQIGRLTSIKGAGFEANFAEKLLDEAAAKVEQG